MSELQNRIIERLAAEGDDHLVKQEYGRHRAFLDAALLVYLSIGGSLGELKSLVGDISCAREINIGQAVANLMVETSAISHAHDIDMVQAAYNWIDNQRK